jgi:hypothetical protein
MFRIHSEPDQDLHGNALIFVGWIWMWIRIENTIADRNSGGQKRPTKIEKI